MHICLTFSEASDDKPETGVQGVHRAKLSVLLRSLAGVVTVPTRSNAAQWPHFRVVALCEQGCIFRLKDKC